MDPGRIETGVIILRHSTKALNLEGQRFGKLIAISKVKTKKQKRRWHCICDCGKRCIKWTQQLRSGLAMHCGCSPKPSGNHPRGPEKRVRITWRFEPSLIEKAKKVADRRGDSLTAFIESCIELRVEKLESLEFPP